MRRECGERFPRHRLQMKPLVSDPGMHHGTCVTHVPWCMSGSLARVGGKTFPVVPAQVQPAHLRIWQEAYVKNCSFRLRRPHLRSRLRWIGIFRLYGSKSYEDPFYIYWRYSNSNSNVVYFNCYISQVQRFKGLKPHWAYLPPSFDHNIHIHDDLIIGKTVLVQAVGIFMHGLWRKYVTCEIKTSSFPITVILISQSLLRRDGLDTPSLIWRGFNIDL